MTPAPHAALLDALTDEQIDADWREACKMHELTRDMVRAFARTTYARAAIAQATEPDLTAPNLACKSVQKRLAEQWTAEQPAPVAALDYRGALADLCAEFKRVFPIYYYAEPWAHDRNAVLLNAELLLSAAPTPGAQESAEGQR